MPPLTRVEVCVVGGGPAGAAAARLLASWGWSVALLHRPSARPPLAESLPPSTSKVLALVGVDAAVATADFFPNTGNSSRWAGQDRRSTSTTPGYHVSRDRWDAVLRGCACDAGARIVEATVRHVDPLGARVVAVDGAGAEFAIACRYLLDCSGRAGVVARLGLRRAVAGYRTLAIAAEWNAREWPIAERTRTFVESYADGWSWSVPLSAGTRQCTVMIDPARLTARRPEVRHDGSTAPAIDGLYTAELGRTHAILGRLRSGRQTKRAWACDASVYDCERAADGRSILVGDAASFIEPLSSAGVKKAMLSAWRAAVVANTCLKSDSARSIAFEYHSAREREVFQACSRQAALFFSEAASAHPGAFWHARAGFGAAGPGSEASGAIDANALDGADVASAFDRLRRNADGRLRVSPRLVLEPTATIEGNEVVLRDALRLHGLADPVRFASNVDLPALVRIVAEHDAVESALLAYRNGVNRIAPTDVLRGLSLLVARRAILHEGVRS